MPFQKGQSGNPNGRPKSSKLFNDMLRLALASKTGDINDGLRVIVRALIAKALGGNMQAIKEVADRLDGRPHQSSDTKISADDPITSLFRKIEENGKRACE